MLGDHGTQRHGVHGAQLVLERAVQEADTAKFALAHQPARVHAELGVPLYHSVYLLRRVLVTGGGDDGALGAVAGASASSSSASLPASAAGVGHKVHVPDVPLRVSGPAPHATRRPRKGWGRHQ